MISFKKKKIIIIKENGCFLSSSFGDLLIQCKWYGERQADNKTNTMSDFETVACIESMSLRR